MQKLFLFLGVISLFAVSAASAAAPNLAGSWEIDKSKSKLSGMLANAENITMDIKQDAKQITLELKVAGSQFPSQPYAYNLDGSENTVDVQGRMPGKATLKAKWTNDGKTLELERKQTVNFQGNDVTFLTTEKLTPSEDGKLLTDERKQESPRGTQEATLVFNKKS